MYEKTVAGLHRIYEVTLTGTPQTVVELLSPADLADYKSILEEDQPHGWETGINSRRSYRRVVVDGYVVCPNAAMAVSTSQSGDQEPVPEGVQFTSPVMFWTENTWFAGGGAAYVRIFFS
jgi:hypothetical protein